MFRQGQEGTEAFRVLMGTVEVIKAIGGRSTSIGYCGPGKIVGEIATLQDRLHMATVTALTDVEVEVIPGDVLLHNFDSSPDVIQDILDQSFERLRDCKRQPEPATATKLLSKRLPSS